MKVATYTARATEKQSPLLGSTGGKTYRTGSAHSGRRAFWYYPCEEESAAMGYEEDIEKILGDFAVAKRKHDEATRKFNKVWERMRNDYLMPLLERTVLIFNQRASETNFSAEARQENASALLIINDTKGETGRISFVASGQRITCWTFVNGDSASEQFDVDKVDHAAIETKVTSFIKKLLQSRTPKM